MNIFEDSLSDPTFEIREFSLDIIQDNDRRKSTFNFRE